MPIITEELKLFFYFHFPLRMGEIEEYINIINECLHIKSTLISNILERAEKEGYRYQSTLAMVIGSNKFKFPIVRKEPEPGLIIADTRCIDVIRELEVILMNIKVYDWNGMMKLLRMIYDLDYDRR